MEETRTGYRHKEKKPPTIGHFNKSLHGKQYVQGNDLWIRAKLLVSQNLEHKAEGLLDQEKKAPKSLDKLLPEKYKEYKSVFEKKALERLPEQKPWDHTIDLVDDYKVQNCKIYPLTAKEQELMEVFLRENLEKGYIRESKLEMASPFFFVAKKESDAL